MSIKDDYYVQAITKDDYEMWLLKKHYAHRIPCIMYAFGLYDTNNQLHGVCTYGPPCRMHNNGYGLFGGKLDTPTFELNRLVINEGMPKNILSYFVAGTFRFMPKPSCLVSYADSNHGHHGYIYQATNWLYTGTGGMGYAFKDEKGQDVHKRTLNSMFGGVGKNNVPEGYELYETTGKYRYIKFIGNKHQCKDMMRLLTYDVLPYPKGENKRYDASYEPKTQKLLF